MKRLFGSISLLALTAASAVAADMMPLKAPPPVIIEGGPYAWVDGFYERVRLPTYSLGFHSISFTAAPFPDLGPVQSFDPRFNSGGVRGAVGYQVPGSTFRLELGGSHVAGSGSLSQTTAATTDVTTTLLNAGAPFGLLCTSGSTCTVNGTLNTSYEAWQAKGKAAYDLSWGLLTVTPSAVLFGGNSRVNQTLAQVAAALGGQTPGTANYNAETGLRWTDAGASVGLDTSIAVTNMLTIGVGGWVGAAGRHASLSGTDSVTSNPPNSVPPDFLRSIIAASDTTTAFVANAEAGFAHTLAPGLIFRGFAGVNYDSKVPGIRSPAFGTLSALTPLPASIYYARETSYYAGGGLRWQFGRLLIATH